MPKVVGSCWSMCTVWKIIRATHYPSFKTDLRFLGNLVVQCLIRMVKKITGNTTKFLFQLLCKVLSEVKTDFHGWNWPNRKVSMAKLRSRMHNKVENFEWVMLVFELPPINSKRATWRIIPVSKWLITMVSKPPNWGCSPSKWPFHGL